MVWSLRPFDPHTHAISAAQDAEALLVLADAGKLARSHGRQLLHPCSIMPATKNVGLEARGIRFVWQGSYRSEAPSLDLSAALRALSPRAAVVLAAAPAGGMGAERADALSGPPVLRYLLAHGVAGRRVLALPSPRRSSRRHPQGGAHGSAERGASMLRFASGLLTVPAIDGTTSGPTSGHQARPNRQMRPTAAGGGAASVAGYLRQRRERRGSPGHHKREAYAAHAASSKAAHLGAWASSEPASSKAARG